VAVVVVVMTVGGIRTSVAVEVTVTVVVVVAAGRVVRISPMA